MQSSVLCKPFYLYDVEFDLWSIESVGLPSNVMWGDRGEVQCCGLSKVWNGGDGWSSSGDVVCHARIC
jgi:hypothetical protein